MPQQPLDPRKSPWKRGDVCTRGFETVGFVRSYTSEYLEILWNGRDGTDKIEEVPAGEVDDILRVAHADSVSPSGRGTNLESLEALEALEGLREAIANRTFRSDRERGGSDNLVRRSFATDGCDWDRKNSKQLLTLALRPETVGVVFKVRERVHRLFCSLSRTRQPSQGWRSAVVQPPAAQTFDLRELRRELAGTQTEAPEVYEIELVPLLDQLEAKYGNNVPVAEMDGLRQLVSAKLADIEKRRHEIINREAKEGKTIEMESLRLNLEASKASYCGPNRDAYVMEIDRLLESLVLKYGSRIPVDHAYKIMQDFDAGRGFTPDE
jgi:hypothetical protein